MSKVLPYKFYLYYKLIKFKPRFLSVFQTDNVSWSAFGQSVTIVEKPNSLSYLDQPKNEINILREVVDKLFIEKRLVESRLAQIYRHSRGKITGREVFLRPSRKCTD